MTTAQEATEELRKIRSMMERATVYRALTGETALVGGAVALLCAWVSERFIGMKWAYVWIAGCAITLLFHWFQLWRIARAKENGKMLSSSLKIAIECALPALMAGGFMGALAARGAQIGHTELAACFWITNYGVALLAIREFVPRSMVWLGWSFVIFGIIALALRYITPMPPAFVMKLNGSRLMALSFGGLHLLYGALIVTTKNRDQDA